MLWHSFRCDLWLVLHSTRSCGFVSTRNKCEKIKPRFKKKNKKFLKSSVMSLLTTEARYFIKVAPLFCGSRQNNGTYFCDRFLLRFLIAFASFSSNLTELPRIMISSFPVFCILLLLIVVHPPPQSLILAAFALTGPYIWWRNALPFHSVHSPSLSSLPLPPLLIYLFSVNTQQECGAQGLHLVSPVCSNQPWRPFYFHVKRARIQSIRHYTYPAPHRPH